MHKLNDEQPRIISERHNMPKNGPASERVPKKLIGLRLHLLSQRRQIQADRTRVRDASLACIQALDVMEDSRPLTAFEACERKKRREVVAELDLRVEMDWRQRS